MANHSAVEHIPRTAGLAGIRMRLAPYALVLPATVVFIVLFVLPFGSLATNSFYGYSRLTGIVPSFTIQNYQKALLDPFHLEIFARTLRLAFVTSIVTLLFGFPVALYASAVSARKRAWIILLILSPLLISVIVRTFGWLIILGPNGLVDTAFASIGLRGVTVLHSEAAIVIGLANVLMPFFVLSALTSIQSIDPAIPLAAASLGASPWRVLMRVIVPLSLPGITSGLLIVFSLATSTFVTPALLGGSQNKVLSVVIYQQALVLQNWPLAAALAVSMIVIVVTILTIQTRLIERGKYRVVFN